MSLIGFKCPPGGEEPGRDNTYDYCLSQCKSRCMPKAMLFKFVEQHRDNVHRGNMITPSALKGCKRKLVLERTTDYYEEPPKLYWAVRGSLIHGFLENVTIPGVSTEKRLYKRFDIDGRVMEVSGQVDFYDEPEAAIDDYKTATDKAFYFLFDTGAKEEHVLQTNVYRLLCNGGNLGGFDGPQVFWPVDKIRIHYLLMGQVISTGRTHVERVNSYKSPNYGKKYKLETSRRVVGKTHRGTPIWEITLEIPPVPLMAEADVLAHIKNNGIKALDGFTIKEAGGMPEGVLYDGDDSWECGYCAVKQPCHAYEQQHRPEQLIQLIDKMKVKDNAKSK